MTESASPPPHGGLAFLVHRDGDDVAVAVHDTEPGEAVGALLDTGQRFGIAVRTAIPLGHKVALRKLAADEAVTEYGVTIGVARCEIPAGDLIHIHNIRSARWHSSL